MRASIPLFRCYPIPDEAADGGDDWRLVGFEADSGIAAEIRRVGHPWAGPMLLLDCETLTGAKYGQGLRFGCFQERGHRYDWRVADAAAGSLTREKLDRLWHEGIFYEPKNCTEDEIELLEYYADTYEMDLYTREEFVRKILHRNHYVKYASNWQDRLREPCYVIGHNIPFDLGALSIYCGLAEKDLYGGLSLVLSGGEHDELVIEKATGNPKQKFEYRAAVKKIGFGKCMYRDGKQWNGSLIKEAGRVRPRYMELVHYLDTMTIGRAELGPGPTSMRDLLRRLNVSKEFQKERADYHGPITFEYIDYCRSDVENTWQIFKAERELYLKHGRSKLMHHLYSEASMGKAYLEDIGIEGFNERNPHFDPLVLGCFMESYYGGRSGCASGI